METTLTAVEVTGRVDEHNRLQLDSALPTTGPIQVRVIVLYPAIRPIVNGTGLTAEPTEGEWLRAAAKNSAFTFLDDPAEDIYTLDDGEPFHDPA